MKKSKQRRRAPVSKGRKIGRLVHPNSLVIFPTRKAASVVKERIDFYGAKLTVEVLNAHVSRLFRSKKVTIAADRLVELREGEIECRVSTYTVRLRLVHRDREKEPPFSAFPNEVPRRLLKNIPVLIETDRRGRFVGLTIFRERPDAASGKGQGRPVRMRKAPAPTGGRAPRRAAGA